MNRIVCAAFTVGLLALSTGCAPNVMFGDSGFRTGVYFGDFGIAGDGNNATILNGSRVYKLSINGNKNVVTFEDDVTLAQIEFWGKGNTVTVPESLRFRVSEVGENNRILRRPVAPVPYTGESAPTEMPPAENVAPPASTDESSTEG